MAKIEFKCKKCRKEFDCETGRIEFGSILNFEKDLICPNCGKRKINELELTELGQTQISELYFQNR